MEKITAAEWCISDFKSAMAVAKALPNRKIIFIPTEVAWEVLCTEKNLSPNVFQTDKSDVVLTYDNGRQVRFTCWCPECRKITLAESQT